MTTPTWPSTIPTFLAAGNYTETDASAVLRSSVDSGPAKVRRRFTTVPRYIAGTLQSLTSTQVETLRSFYYSDCSGGTLVFSWVHPRTGNDATFRWNDNKFPDVSLYNNTPGKYQVSINLELMSEST